MQIPFALYLLSVCLHPPAGGVGVSKILALDWLLPYKEVVPAGFALSALLSVSGLAPPPLCAAAALGAF